jgi:hypothetical protein
MSARGANRPRRLPFLSAFLLCSTLASGLVPAASVLAQGAVGVPLPESVLGYRVGADRKLADWSKVSGYFGKLAA